MNPTRKRLRDAGVANIDEWPDEDIIRFSRIPVDIVKLIMERYLNVTDIDALCKAIGENWCEKYKVFEFIFKARYGWEEWDKFHEFGQFANDMTFLRAYEIYIHMTQLGFIRLEDANHVVAIISGGDENFYLNLQRLVGRPTILQIDSINVLNPRIMPHDQYVLYIVRQYTRSKYDMIVFLYDLMSRFKVVGAHDAQGRRHYLVESSPCANCGKVDPLWKCGNCAKVAYCGRDCQLADWGEGHSDRCQSL